LRIAGFAYDAIAPFTKRQLCGMALAKRRSATTLCVKPDRGGGFGVAASLAFIMHKTGCSPRAACASSYKRYSNNATAAAILCHHDRRRLLQGDGDQVTAPHSQGSV